MSAPVPDEPSRDGPDGEPAAVRARYAQRLAGDWRYHPLNPSARLAWQGRQTAIAERLRAQGLTDTASLRLTEVGCGAGGLLLDCLQLGFRPGHLTGIELLPERLAAARERLPASLRLLGGDATSAPIDTGSQDIVLQSTVFSSLLDDAFQQRLADTLWRWVRPGGAVLWYDFTMDNPRNPDVRGVPLARVRALFPQAELSYRRLTLAPPLSRALCRVSPRLVPWFDWPPLRTHVLAWLRKPA